MSGIHANLSRDIAIATVFGGLAIMMVILRFTSRRITRTGYELDDWMALLSLLSFLVLLASGLWATISGTSQKDPMEGTAAYLKGLFVAILFSPLCITACKLSVLHFYKRVFAPSGKFLLSIHIVAGVCIAWYIAASLAYIFQCSPVQKAWQPWIPGQCINFSAFVVGIEVPNALTDFIMVAMPINVIRSLHLPLRFKIAISAIFLLGALVGIVGLVRISVIYHPGQVDISLLGVLGSLQLLLAIFCACLPAFRPLLPKNAAVFTVFHNIGTTLRLLASNVSQRFTRTTSDATNTGEAASLGATSRTGYNMFGNGVSDNSISLAQLAEKKDSQVFQVSVDSDSRPDTSNLGRGTIMVNREYHVV